MGASGNATERRNLNLEGRERFGSFFFDGCKILATVLVLKNWDWSWIGHSHFK